MGTLGTGGWLYSNRFVHAIFSFYDLVILVCLGLQLGTGIGLGKTDGLKGIGQQQPTSLGLGLG